MQKPNQFSQTALKGQLDLTVASLIISATVDAAQVADLVAGQVVAVAATAGGTPKVIANPNDTTPLMGVVVYNTRHASFPARENLEIAMGGTVVQMEASAAIVRGAQVMNVVAGEKVATATIGKVVVGMALDAAAADGDLIRVMIVDVTARVLSA